MTGPRIGGLCSGTGALEQGLMSVVGGSVAWHCENDPHAAKVLAARYSGVPNYGDLTTTDWTQVEPVDWLSFGFPCQDVSPAGKRAGITPGSRSGLWFAIAHVIDQLRPANLLIENSRGLLSARADRGVEPGDEDLGAVAADAGRAVGVVLGDLADLGFDARWTVVRASDAGAPHIRARVFVIAADTDRLGLERAGRARGRRGGPADLREPPADADEPGQQGSESAGRHKLPARCAATDSARDGRDEGRAESARLVGRPDAAERRHTPTTDADDIEQPRQRLQHVGATPAGHCEAACAVARDWRIADGRDYGPAIRRWHDLTRCVPPPTVPDGRNGAHRLSPRFTEWMMGLPAGWVTDVLWEFWENDGGTRAKRSLLMPRNPALKALGNGCVPQQVALAVRTLLSVEQVAA